MCMYNIGALYMVQLKRCERKNENSIDTMKKRVGMIFVGVVGAAARTDPLCKHARETWRGRLAYHKLEVEGGGGVGRISRESRLVKWNSDSLLQREIEEKKRTIGWKRQG